MVYEFASCVSIDASQSALMVQCGRGNSAASTDPFANWKRRRADAIRSMSQNFTDEVAPSPTWITRVSEVTRVAPLTSAVIGLLGMLIAPVVSPLSTGVYQDWRKATTADFFIWIRYSRADLL